MSTENQLTELEVLPPSSVESLQRGEIDVQIATAHRFPRSIAGFKKRALDMATLDEETAASCIYCRPVGKENGKPKYAEGLSIRAAEIVGASYGNLRVGATIVEMTPRFVKARGFAHDLETNFASATEVVEATVKKDGTPYDERMRVVIAKAALAKARRDATFQVVPRALAKPIEAECRKIAVGDASTLEKRRAAVMQWAGKLGIDVARVFAALGIKGEEDIGVEQLTTLTGLRTAIKDGDVKIDEAFPEIREKIQEGNPDFSGSSEKASTPEQSAQPARSAKKAPDGAAEQSASPEPEADRSGPPPFEPETPEDHLRIALRDMDVNQADFVAGLRKILPDKVPKQAKVVADLRADVIAMIEADGLDAIMTLIRAKK